MEFAIENALILRKRAVSKAQAGAPGVCCSDACTKPSPQSAQACQHMCAASQVHHMHLPCWQSSCTIVCVLCTCAGAVLHISLLQASQLQPVLLRAHRSQSQLAASTPQRQEKA